MKTFQRFGIVIVLAVAFLAVAGYLTDPKWAALLSLVGSVLAAPFGQRLIDWVDRGSDTASEKGSTASTALIVCATYVYVLLVINLCDTSVVSAFDSLEARDLIKFTDQGYREAQLYVAGAIGLPLLFSAVIAVSCFIGVSFRRLSLVSFALGTYAAFPAFFVIAWWSGLPFGYEHPTAWALLRGIFTLLISGAVLSTVGWGIARASRFVGTRERAVPSHA
jgi:hypothetical protein